MNRKQSAVPAALLTLGLLARGIGALVHERRRDRHGSKR